MRLEMGQHLARIKHLLVKCGGRLVLLKLPSQQTQLDLNLEEACEKESRPHDESLWERVGVSRLNLKRQQGRDSI